ncbi:hypothetical protein ASG47_03005 [Devosia sp. Leaf420]|nr:hypothetical protein ASG47_03005 [Devosia sp. Leaf420]
MKVDLSVVGEQAARHSASANAAYFTMFMVAPKYADSERLASASVNWEIRKNSSVLKMPRNKKGRHF